MREPKEIPLPTILLSEEETADLLGLGRTHTYELVMSGKIASVKIGRRRLVIRAELQRFIERLSVNENPMYPVSEPQALSQSAWSIASAAASLSGARMCP
jgi:excisionase family DNA binding protein